MWKYEETCNLGFFPWTEFLKQIHIINHKLEKNEKERVYFYQSPKKEKEWWKKMMAVFSSSAVGEGPQQNWESHKTKVKTFLYYIARDICP